MRGDNRPEAPNYVNACLVMFGVNLAWIFTVIWAIWGLILVMVLGLVINHAMTRLQAAAQARAMRERAAPRAKVRS